MQKLYIFIALFCSSIHRIFALDIRIGRSPDNSITAGDPIGWELVDVLSFIEELLLKVALPLVIVGSSLYIAYELFLAEGNEEKLKQAWKSMTYAFV
jgi:hypothetical protein